MAFLLFDGHGITAILGALLAAYAAAWVFLHLGHDPREPPLAPCIIPIPFIGPIIEMRWKNSRFPLYMKAKFPKPIYTVRIPGKRFYFINSITLIPAVQRQSRILSFETPLIKGLRSILGVSRKTLDIMDKDVGVVGKDSFLSRLNKSILPSLSAGPSLDDMYRRSVLTLEDGISELSKEAPAVVNMYDWVRTKAILATTNAVFGPKNPFKDPVNITAWVKFEMLGMPLLALDVLPDWAIGEGVRAREVLVKAFTHYLADGGHDQASDFFRRRMNFYRGEGLPDNDTSRLAVADNIAFSSNLVPTVFWLLYHVFADPTVLEECRSEVLGTIRHQKDGTQVIIYDAIKNSCPVLQSTFREVFRYHGFGLVPRRALEDHLLNNEYLIKKGGTIFTPYRVQHHDIDNWGQDQAQFYHRRFLKEAGSKRHNPAALRGYGNGAHLCPGRHFASAEVVLFAALMIARFDAEPTGGFWPEIPVGMSSQVAAVDQPDHDLEVEFRPRQGVRQEQWKVEFSPNEHAVDDGSGNWE